MTSELRTPLPLQTKYLLQQRYQLKKVIGFGGFSITYLAIDTMTNTQTALKEYFPSQFAVRENSGSNLSVKPISDSDRIYFEQGLLQIQREAELLRHFSELEHIVSLYDCFEENNTIYLVMEFIEGITLKQYVQDAGKMNFPNLLSLMTPILQELSVIHSEGLYHRDITPDNLILGIDNRLHLIDFGAAKQNNPLSKKNTVILRTGYAPPEQYLPDGKLGPWVDVYGICATMFFCLTANSPSDALQRTEKEIFDLLQENTNMQSFEIATLCKGMSLRIADRFVDTKALLQAFLQKSYGEHTIYRNNLSKSEQKALYQLRKNKIIRQMRISVMTIFVIAAVVGSALIVHHTFRDSGFVSEQSKQGEESLSSAVTGAAESEQQILTMPMLTGKTLKQAKKELKKIDTSLQINTTYQYQKNKKTGIVLNQSIPADTSFVSGQITSVLLTINKKTTADKDDAVNSSSPSPTTSGDTASDKKADNNQATSSPVKNKNRKTEAPDSYTIKTQEPYVSVPLG